MERWRQVAIFAGAHPGIIIWRGFLSAGRVYPLNQQRAHRLGRLLDATAVVKLVFGEPMYTWNDWNWSTAKGGK